MFANNFTHNQIKNSYQFLFWWFNDIMAIQFDEIPWTPKTRSEEIRKITNDYRTLFLNSNYSDIQIWKIIIKKYHKNWCNLHWYSYEYEKKSIGPRAIISLNKHTI